MSSLSPFIGCALRCRGTWVLYHHSLIMHLGSVAQLCYVTIHWLRTWVPCLMGCGSPFIDCSHGFSGPWALCRHSLTVYLGSVSPFIDCALGFRGSRVLSHHSLTVYKVCWWMHSIITKFWFKQFPNTHTPFCSLSQIPLRRKHHIAKCSLSCCSTIIAETADP